MAANDAAQHEQPVAGNGLSFIHSALDDFGLPPAPFRIYCHLLRVAGADGVCWQSIATMAKSIGLHPDTVRPGLSLLIKHRLIAGEDRPGRTNHYRPRPSIEWIPLGNFRRGRKMTTGKNPEGRGGKKPEGHPPEKLLAEGSPSEGSPLEGNLTPFFYSPSAANEAACHQGQKKENEDLVWDRRSDGPPWEWVLRWLAEARKNGATYTEEEARSAWLYFNGNGWMSGKNKVADWRAAIERQIQFDRDRRGTGITAGLADNPRAKGCIL